MAKEIEMRDLLGQELAELAGADVERWVKTGAARSGTESGARLGARFTKVDHFELAVELPEAQDAALCRREVLSEEGDLRDFGEDGVAAPAVPTPARMGGCSQQSCQAISMSSKT
jgi:hypothetical protein